MQIANLIIFADSASILFLVDRQNPKKRGRKEVEEGRGGEGRRFFSLVDSNIYGF